MTTVSPPVQVSTSTAGASSQQGSLGLGTLTSQDFLQLLVAQISNQDPLNPLSSSDFMSQTAELSTLEQVTALEQETTQVLAAEQLTAAIATIGHTVNGTAPDGRAASGDVTGVQDTTNGPLLDIGGSQVPFSDITTID